MKRREFLAGAVALGTYQMIPGVGVGNALAGSGSNRRLFNQHNQPDDSKIRDAVRKANNFEENYRDDVYIPQHKRVLLGRVNQRLNKLQQLVGYANFNLISFDAARYYARNYSRVGSFTQAESELIEDLFDYNAAQYGFFGRKLSDSLTETINKRDVQKIRGTGHYLYQGDAINLYTRMRRQLGHDLILTSGIRSVVKQVHLFIAKAVKSDGNLSRAARSLAPPGHSFHGIGDFDVGQRGLGAANFTNEFARTELHARLEQLGLITMRYPMSNPYGVRHEPWHIKVVTDV